MTTITPVPIGTAIIHFNQWTGFRTKRFNDLLVRLTAEQVKALKPGDVVYVDTDPLYPQGKVYGWVKASVTEVAEDARGEIKVHYSADKRKGFISGAGNAASKLYVAKDEEAIARLVEEMPLSTMLDG